MWKNDVVASGSTNLPRILRGSYAIDLNSKNEKTFVKEKTGLRRAVSTIRAQQDNKYKNTINTIVRAQQGNIYRNQAGLIRIALIGI